MQEPPQKPGQITKADFARFELVTQGNIHKILEAIKGGEVGQAEEVFRLTAKKIDRAGARSIIHPNKAARIKSRLQKRIKAAKA